MRASIALETLWPIHTKIWNGPSCNIWIWNRVKHCLTLKIN